MEDIKTMIARLNKGEKNPHKFAEVAPNSFIRFSRKEEIQKMFDGYYELIQEQNREIERLKKELEESKATA